MMNNNSDRLFYGMIVAILSFAIVMTVQMAFAEEFYGSNYNTSIFVTFDGNLSKIEYKSVYGTSEHFDSEIKQFQHGGFFLKSPEIVIFGHPIQNDQYTLTVMTSMGFERFVVTSIDFSDVEVKEEPKRDPLAEYEKAKEITGMGFVVPEKKESTYVAPPQYIPELLMASSHDFRTYWKETFNIDVQAYDGRINPKAVGFDGRLDNANVTVTISHEDTVINLSGVTTYGNWDGESYFPENISTPGEYIVDVIVSYLNQTVSKSSSMFVLGTTSDSGSSNKDYDNDGILNVDDLCPNDAEDFLGVDEDRDSLTGDGCPE